MSVAQIIAEKLSPLEAEILDIIDESHKHAGHLENRESLESHFKVKIVSDQFIGKSMVSRHKLVYKLLEQELAGPIHALALKTLTRGENF